MALVEANGTTLYYTASGTGSPLVFVHGGGGSADSWAGQVDQLSSEFHCIAYDRRGHSRSPLGEGVTRTVQVEAGDTAALIQALGIAPCVLVGTSAGGRVVYEVVRQFPMLVAGAVFAEPALKELDPYGGAAFAKQVQPVMAAAIARSGPDAATEAFIEIISPGLWPTLSAARQARYRENGKRLLEDMTTPPHDPVTRAALAQLTRPCLAISGRQSLSVFRTITGIVAESIPMCQLVELAGAGHLTYLDRPDEFAAAVAAFARSVS